MTIFFPDIASYQAGLKLQLGTVAVIAKATQGTRFIDPNYADFKAQAGRLGTQFSAYHFLEQGNGAAQADHAFAVVGAAVPLMLDVEPWEDIGSRPTIADCRAFIGRYQQLGGRVWATYFPRWYWQETGGDLGALGTPVIASGYPGGYSDNDPNWAPYGEITPVIWQYTNKQSYGGKPVDFNAFRGSVAELAALIGGTTPPANTSGGDMTYKVDLLGWSRDYPDVAAALAAHIPTGTEVDAERAAAMGMMRSFVAAERTGVIEELVRQLLARPAAGASVDVVALAAALGPSLHPTVDVGALVAQLVPHLPGQVDAGVLAQALATHIKVV